MMISLQPCFRRICIQPLMQSVLTRSIKQTAEEDKERCSRRNFFVVAIVLYESSLQLTYELIARIRSLISLINSAKEISLQGDRCCPTRSFHCGEVSRRRHAV